MSTDHHVNHWGQIVAKAWQDESFKKRLLANPAAVLKDQGLETPAGVQLRVLENTDRLVHLTIPARPNAAELSDAALDAVAGGGLVSGLMQALYGKQLTNQDKQPQAEQPFQPQPQPKQ